MASIGGYNFITLGMTEPPKQEVEVVRRPNLDGVELQRLGKAGQPERYLAVADLAIAGLGDPPSYALDLKAALDGYRALQGETVTVYDDHDIGTGNIAIISVRIPPTFNGRPNPRKIAMGAGGLHGTAATHVVVVEFIMVDTNIPIPF